MTVRFEGRGDSGDAHERRPLLNRPSKKMAILTRHAALEAFPSGDTQQCVGARCPLVKSSHHRLPMHHHHPQQQHPQHQQQIVEEESPPRGAFRGTSSPVKSSKSKSSARNSSFEKKGPTWVAATMLQSDLLVEVADMSFHLHKFPLLSRSGRLNRLVFESRDTEKDHINLPNFPGGPATFELAVKFCYGIPIAITPSNVAALRCAADYLEMTEDLEVSNLVSQTEDFLSSEILTSWSDSIAVLRTCATLLPWAETLHIVRMCSESIAWKACTDPRGIRWSYSSDNGDSSPSSRTSGSSKLGHTPHDWWFADVAELDLRSFKVVMDAVHAKGMRHDMMGSAILHYAYRHLPSLQPDHPSSPNNIISDKKKNKVSKLSQSSSYGDSSDSASASKRAIFEGIVAMLPSQKDSLPVSGLLRLLRVAIHLDASLASRRELEHRCGMHLDQATLNDLLIPSFRCDTTYDVGAIHRCLDHFLVQDHIQMTSQCNKDVVMSSGRDKNGDVYDASHVRPPVGPHTAKMKVAKLMDSYLAEIARDGALGVGRFQALAEALPEFSRLTDDGLYRAIDTFLKAHPGLSEHERKKLCRMMDCQRLSLEACVHAAQNERLPLRIVVQVLFSEQLKLRNAISRGRSGATPRGSGVPSAAAATGAPSEEDHGAARPPPLPSLHDGAGESNQMDIRALQHDVMFMKARFAELQKDYSQVTQQVEKLTRQKGSWVKRLFQSKDNGDGVPSSPPAHPRWSRPWRNSIS